MKRFRQKALQARPSPRPYPQEADFSAPAERSSKAAQRVIRSSRYPACPIKFT
eukprot:CAMPEP_0204440852 /NCGR_PEP_ID=MMETSP0470-20130426/84111_1 /ASSEMBLY_ACC=CAM_ASM_000385 /TAXON_ID=2969 /ORGANISM="Oxyrrhis marina" /LENGTH=52 /DNA_ID=CAMNT_0051439919 /DNA_START=20 /DNA_END=174 /DNA_ORIENTATION=+